MVVAPLIVRVLLLITFSYKARVYIRWTYSALLACLCYSTGSIYSGCHFFIHHFRSAVTFTCVGCTATRHVAALLEFPVLVVITTPYFDIFTCVNWLASSFSFLGLRIYRIFIGIVFSDKRMWVIIYFHSLVLCLENQSNLNNFIKPFPLHICTH